MKTSLNGKIALAVSEGVVVNPYKDSVGVWTVGIGHTKNAGGIDPAKYIGKTFSIQEIMDIFTKDLVKFENRVNSLVKVPLKQHEFDALVHFDFNTGGLHRSNLLKNLNAGNKTLAWSSGFHGWLKPAELLGRRNKERAMAQGKGYGSTIAPLYTANSNGKLTRNGTIDIKAHLKPTESVQVPKTPEISQKPSTGILEVIVTILKALFGSK